MELNQTQLSLVNRINSTVYFKLFSVFKLPLAFITGLKVIEFNTEQCVTSVRLEYLNKNPFSSIYFAVLAMAAELSTGTFALLASQKTEPGLLSIVTSIRADFIKKATGHIQFRCQDGNKAFESVQKAIETSESKMQTLKTVGFNEDGEIVAEFEFTWSFKVKD